MLLGILTPTAGAVRLLGQMGRAGLAWAALLVAGAYALYQRRDLSRAAPALTSGSAPARTAPAAPAGSRRSSARPSPGP